MAIFLLCIPLIIFLVAEGTVIYLMITKITSALLEEGFTSSTYIDEATPSLTAIMYAFGLIVIAGIITWIYIRFIIISAAKNRKKEKEQKSNDSEINEDGDSNNFFKENITDESKAKKPAKKKKKTKKQKIKNR